MPLTVPTLDDRSYQQLRDEALARIPVHNPEWTNFNESDPGVTLVEVFAFLTESLLYRANRIPEKNRRKFLTLLGQPLRPAASAQGLVAFANERGASQTFTFNGDLEVRAGQVPFRTTRGLDVLPVEAQVFFKQKVAAPTAGVRAYYDQLYATFGVQTPGAQFSLYQTAPLDAQGSSGVDLGADTVDGALWVALLLRSGDKPYSEPQKTQAREALAGMTLSLGLVPVLVDGSGQLSPGGPTAPDGSSALVYEIPALPPGGVLPSDPGARTPRYMALDASPTADVVSTPGVVDLSLPADPTRLRLWANVDPLESGVGDFPPALTDSTLNDRLLTWVRVRQAARVRARLLWVGINAAPVSQRTHVSAEALPDGTGEPDQSATLARTPVVPGSVSVTVTVNGVDQVWGEIDDLTAAGPEVPAPDPARPPGTPPVVNPRVNVFAVDPESGVLRFGDGTRGRRPPFGALVRASYDYGAGPGGNVGPGTISTGPALPAGFTVTNPVRTWGGTDAETAAEGETQVSRYLQHRDRLVTAGDFATIARRTPGVALGRVEVLPAYHPDLSTNAPGDAPGAVTLMIIPAYDPTRPGAPVPDQLTIDAVCDYLDPRRLVTTEVFLRPPNYVRLWVSVGLNIVAGFAAATVREAVKAALLQYLSPLPDPSGASGGWPLRTPVVDRELLVVAGRVPGVLSINDVKLALDTGPSTTRVAMTGLELPWVVNLAVAVGDPPDLDALRGTGTAAPPSPTFVPVPVIPEGC